MNKNIFFKRLKELRLSKNLKQDDLAKEIGLKKSSIGMIEQGNRMASVEILYKIADFFDVSIDYLLGRNNNPDSHKN